MDYGRKWCSCPGKAGKHSRSKKRRPRPVAPMSRPTYDWGKRAEKTSLKAAAPLALVTERQQAKVEGRSRATGTPDWDARQHYFLDNRLLQRLVTQHKAGTRLPVVNTLQIVKVPVCGGGKGHAPVSTSAEGLMPRMRPALSRAQGS